MMLKAKKSRSVAVFLVAILWCSFSSCSKEKEDITITYSVSFIAESSEVTAEITMFEYDKSWNCVDSNVAYLADGERKQFTAHPDATKLTVLVVKKDNGMTIKDGWLDIVYLVPYRENSFDIWRYTKLYETEPTHY